jgi:hypothetical protein
MAAKNCGGLGKMPCEKPLTIELAVKHENGRNSSKNSLDLLAEGLVSEKSRGERTPLELFRSGVQGLPATIRAALCQAATG